MEFIYILPEGQWEALALQEVLGGNQAEIQHYTVTGSTGRHI